ncbi:MAG: C2H2-type zinc finger protein [Candidatus Omnitrophota bacterium]
MPITVGDQIQIIVPLTITKIGTADLECEYSAGSINKKLYIPKIICVTLAREDDQSEGPIPTITYPVSPGPPATTTASHPVGTSGYVPVKQYTCDVCGKSVSTPLALCGHKRSHKTIKPKKQKNDPRK